MGGVEEEAYQVWENLKSHETSLQGPFKGPSREATFKGPSRGAPFLQGPSKGTPLKLFTSSNIPTLRLKLPVRVNTHTHILYACNAVHDPCFFGISMPSTIHAVHDPHMRVDDLYRFYASYCGSVVVTKTPPCQSTLGLSFLRVAQKLICTTYFPGCVKSSWQRNTC